MDIAWSMCLSTERPDMSQDGSSPRTDNLHYHVQPRLHQHRLYPLYTITASNPKPSRKYPGNTSSRISPTARCLRREIRKRSLRPLGIPAPYTNMRFADTSKHLGDTCITPTSIFHETHHRAAQARAALHDFPTAILTTLEPLHKFSVLTAVAIWRLIRHRNLGRPPQSTSQGRRTSVA